MNANEGSDSSGFDNVNGDDGWGSAEPPTVAAVPQSIIDRNERIQAMLQAGSTSGITDDDVTDFILHMQHKNSLMMEQAQGDGDDEEAYDDYDDGNYSSDDEENNKDELDASFSKNNMALRRRHQDHSPDEYPPGEAYAGDEVGEESDIPSFDPKDDDLISNGRLCCIVCVLIISMVAMSLLVILFIVVLDDAEGGSEKKYGYTIPTAPPNLSQMCSVQSLATPAGNIACREPCREAACCWETGENGLGLDPVCWDDNPLDCAPYQVCINLLSAGAGQGQSESQPTGDTSSYVEPAPADIDSCDPSIVASSVDELLLCEDACSHAPCCWKESVQSCIEHPNCASYSRCDILNVDGPIAISGNAPDDIPEPASDIAVLCSEPANSLQMCAHYCSMGECCWKSHTTTTTNPNGGTTTQTIAGTCKDHPVCDHYETCTVLNNEDISSGTVAIPKAPEGLDFICSTNAAECVQDCNEATCCWKTTTVTSTSGGLSVSENIEGICATQPECKDYEPCTVLQHEGVSSAVSIPPAPADLASVCTSATEQCNVYCREAPCCWEHVVVTTTNNDTGEKYSSTLEGSCSGQPSCDPYQPCSILQSASMPPTNGPNTVDVPTPPEDLASSCNPPNANEVGALDQCTEACFKATCCWMTETIPTTSGGTESIAGTCSQQPECQAYSPCSTLEDDLFSPHSPGIDSNPPAPAPATNAPAPTGGDAPAEVTEEAIYGACYNHNDLPGVKTLCEEVCESASCCYTSGEACQEGFVCDKYWPCHKLLQDENGDGVAEVVNKACNNSGDEFDFADCLELCGHSTCCFTSDVTKSCDEIKANIECSEYAGCESLYSGGNGR